MRIKSERRNSIVGRNISMRICGDVSWIRSPACGSLSPRNTNRRFIASFGAIGWPFSSKPQIRSLMSVIFSAVSTSSSTP